MICNKENRISRFSYLLRDSLYDTMRKDFINKFYMVNKIHDQEIKEIFEEAIHEMNFNVFKEIYEMCHLIGYDAAKPVIAEHINIMMKTKNPTYPAYMNLRSNNYEI